MITVTENHLLISVVEFDETESLDKEPIRLIREYNSASGKITWYNKMVGLLSSRSSSHYERIYQINKQKEKNADI